MSDPRSVSARARIGLTGGIASGKSTVAGMFAELGAIILDADQAARDVVQPGRPGWQKLRPLLGEDYFDQDGQLKRRKLRQRIIEDGECRAQVNAILHPEIMAALAESYENCRQLRPHSLVIFDIPLLFESGLAHHFDCVILVYVDREVQIRRLIARDKTTREEAERSLLMQMPLDEKKQQAHFVVDNSGSTEQTFEQVRGIWEHLQALLQKASEAGEAG